MDSTVFSSQTTISYSQVDPFGCARSIALMQLLEEAAIGHCQAIDRDVFVLLSEGFGWILRSGSLRFLKYPRYRDFVRIDTWVSHWTPFRGVREFVLVGNNGDIYAKASTLWAYIDIERRRPVPIPEVFRARWPVDNTRAVNARFIKGQLELPKRYTTETFDVRRHDIDSNNHVHNVRYLEWVLETVPEEYFHGRVLDSVDGTFIQEAHLDEQILVQAGSLGEVELVHNVVRRSDGEVLSTGRSKWRDPYD